MGINLPQLGIDAELSKSFALKEVATLSNKVNDINIAQKTVNTRGSKELLSSRLEMILNTATTGGNPILTTISKTIDLKDSIEKYIFLNFQLDIKTATRYFLSDITTINVSEIKYNNTNVYDSSDGSALFMYFNILRTDPGNWGSGHIGMRFWFKTPTQIYVDIATNPYIEQEYKGLGLISVKGVNVENVTIDPVKYVNTTQGIEDSPVGNIISMAGGGSLPHYLKCDGSIYNITDYPHLSQYFKDQFGKYDMFGGDGVTTFAVPIIYDKLYGEDMLDITPQMTSATTPVPYKVTQSSYLATGGLDRSGWKAFDKNNVYDPTGKNVSYWTTNNVKEGWLVLDFGKKTDVTNFSITTRTKYSTDPTYSPDSPKDFSIYGSNDGTNYELIVNITNQVDWTWDNTRVFSFSKKASYRYYKLDILSNNGAVYTSVTELKYLFNTSSYRCIKYEPTYFMQVEGLIEETTLWEGSKVLMCDKDMTQFTNENAILADNVNNYDMIRLIYTWYRTSDSLSLIPSHVDWLPTEDNPFFGIIFNYTFIVRAEMANDKITFHSSISRDRGNTSGNALKVSKVIGIKYKSFQKGV